MPDNFTRRTVTILCCFLYLAAFSTALAKNTSKVYPEQGKVIAKTVSAKATALRVPVFRVETEMKIYEFEVKDSEIAVGDAIQFRIEKDWAYVQQGNKEQKFRVIDTQLKDDD